MPHFLNIHPLLRLVRPLDIGVNKHTYAFRELMLNSYSVLIPCIQRYEGDISRRYSRSLCRSTLLQNWGSVTTLTLCHIFIVANLFYLIFALLGRFWVLSWSLAYPLWDANYEGWYWVISFWTSSSLQFECHEFLLRFG